MRQQTPLGIGESLGQVLFVFADGRKALHEFGDVSFVYSGIVARQQDGASGQAVFTALRDDLALPVSDVGPVESCAFRWFTASWLAVGTTRAPEK